MMVSIKPQMVARVTEIMETIDRSQPCPVSILELLKSITRYQHCPTTMELFTQLPTLKNLFETINKNFRDHTWDVAPGVWIPLIKDEFESLVDEYEDVDDGTSVNYVLNRLADNPAPSKGISYELQLLKWVRRPDGIRDLFIIVDVLLNLNTFSKKVKNNVK